MKNKTKILLDNLRGILEERDNITYSDDTLIETALINEIERIKEE